jgi:hypothetical protein
VGSNQNSLQITPIIGEKWRENRPFYGTASKSATEKASPQNAETRMRTGFFGKEIIFG